MNRSYSLRNAIIFLLLFSFLFALIYYLSSSYSVFYKKQTKLDRNLPGMILLPHNNSVYSFSPNNVYNKTELFSYIKNELHYVTFEKEEKAYIYVATEKKVNGRIIDKIVTNVNGKNKVLLELTRSGSQNDISEKPTIFSPRFTNNGSILFIRVQKNGESSYYGALYELNLTNKKLYKKTTDQIDVFSFFSYSRLNDQVLYVKDNFIYKLDMKVEKITPIVKGYSPTWFNYNEFIYGDEGNIYLYNLKQNTKKQIGQGAIDGSLSVSPDKKYIIYRSHTIELREQLIVAALNGEWKHEINLLESFDYYPCNVQWIE